MAVAVALGLACLVGRLALAGSRGRRPKIIRHPDPVLTVTARSPAPGTIAVSASAQVTHPFRDPVLWFAVEARRRIGPDRVETVWEHSYDGAGEFVGAKRGVEAKLTLPEKRIEGLAPGTYSVLVMVKENAGAFTEDGQIEEPSHIMIADSVWVDVK